MDEKEIRIVKQFQELMDFSNKKPYDPTKHPNFKNKGKRGLRCNRTACECEEAFYWNKTTQAYYCQPCAIKINMSSNQSGMGDLCIMLPEDREAWVEKRKQRRLGYEQDQSE